MGKYASVIFDGTTRLGEVLVVVLRIVNGWTVQQRLVRLKFLKKSMKGEEVARELIQLMSTELGIQSHLLLAATRDGASVNSVAMNTVSIIYPSVTDIRCFSHTQILLVKSSTRQILAFFQHFGYLFFHIAQKLSHCGGNRLDDLWLV